MLAFIRNNWRLNDSPTKAKLRVKRTDVVWLQQREKVFEEIAHLLGEESASTDTKGWFSKRMTAIGNIIAAMDQTEKDALDKEAGRDRRHRVPTGRRMRFVHPPALSRDASLTIRIDEQRRLGRDD